MPNVRKVALISAAVLLAQILLTHFLYPLIGKSTVTVFSIQPVSGIGGQVVGDKILGYLTGYIPFDLSNWAVWISIYLGAFILMYVGMFIADQRYFKVWTGKNIYQRLFAILLYGHIALYIALLALKWGTVPSIALNLAIGLVINLVLVSALVTLSAKQIGFPKV